jgi:hypothetical protein
MRRLLAWLKRRDGASGARPHPVAPVRLNPPPTPDYRGQRRGSTGEAEAIGCRRGWYRVPGQGECNGGQAR